VEKKAEKEEKGLSLRMVQDVFEILIVRTNFFCLMDLTQQKKRLNEYSFIN
jgi:hypothetical protein